MKRIMCVAIVAALACSACGGKKTGGEIRVLLANHPYGELLKSLIPEFEKESGVKAQVESLQEAQLTQKLTTEFATNSSSADVFMTRPLQETLLFNKNGWYAPLDAYDFSDYPANTVDIGRKDGAPYIVPLVTEWQVLYYRKDLLDKAGLKVPADFAELEAAAKALSSGDVAGFGARGAGAAAVTQLSSYIYNFGGRYVSGGVAAFDSPKRWRRLSSTGACSAATGPRGLRRCRGRI